LSSSSRSVGLLCALFTLVLFPGCQPPPARSGLELAQIRDYEAQKRKREVVVIETDFGRIVIVPANEPAKNTARRFKELVDQGFYDGLAFHYAQADKMIQGGDINSRDDDPSNDGLGNPGFTIEAEIGLPNVTGSVGLAHPPGEPNKGNSQFYILLADMPNLNGRYTVFGHVTEGLDIVRKISRVETDQEGRPLKKVLMKKVYVEERVV
jgi:cyclophilin family peptidyl-prolyl cis-trans isomerase